MPKQKTIEINIPYDVPDDLWFFEGHFPGVPVFPGIMLLSLGIDNLRHKYPAYAGFKLHSISYCRFKSIVKPKDNLLLKYFLMIMPDNKIEINFSIERSFKICLKAKLFLIKGAVDDS